MFYMLLFILFVLFINWDANSRKYPMFDFTCYQVVKKFHLGFSYTGYSVLRNTDETEMAGVKGTHTVSKKLR